MTPTFMRLGTLTALAVMTLAVGACDHALTTTPGDRVSADQLIIDAATAQAALSGAYDAMQSGSYYGLDLQLLGDLPSDNGQWAGTYQFLGEIANNRIAADNPEVTALWTAIYRQLDRDNVVISRVPTLSGVADNVKNPILGEAYLMRALGYHNLVKFWGDVPMPLAPVVVASDAAEYARTPALQVYAQVLSDLDKAIALITNSSDTRRGTVMAARALKARVLFYRASVAGANAAADYQAALDLANVVLSGRDTLTVPFANLFSATGANTAEDIWRVSFTASESNSLGYYWLYAGRHEARPTTGLRNAYDATDLRLPLTVGPRSSTSSTLEGKKWPTTAGAEHPHIIRLAELVLIKAEALARLNQLPAAVAEYNKVRVRAGLAPHVLGTNVTTQADVINAIVLERRRELALEGDRWPDLVRLGQAATVKAFSDRPGQALFPIPLRDITTSPKLVQNPGY